MVFNEQPGIDSGFYLLGCGDALITVENGVGVGAVFTVLLTKTAAENVRGKQDTHTPRLSSRALDPRTVRD